MIRVSRLVRW